MNKADDNGEHMFTFMLKKKQANIKAYYCLSKIAPDYKRLSKIGPVLNFQSFRFQLQFLLSDKVISASADNFFLNPFGNDERYLRDIFHFSFVFLQHGITKDNISKWIHRFNKNIKLFVVAGRAEYLSLLDPSYGYDNNSVQLLGFPRFDELLHKQAHTRSSHQILVMPTWRKYITQGKNIVTPSATRFELFNLSSYFRFYNALLHHPRLCEEMLKNGYHGLFCQHPLFVNHWSDFTPASCFSVQKIFTSYATLFAESSLLVTDYSSVAFDFAYLRKPVIYTQFDRDYFFTHHSYRKGYFDYADNGFGPVCYDLESTVDMIIHYIHLNCSLQQNYLSRIETFYGYSDDHNRERVYHALSTLTDDSVPPLNRLFSFILLLICTIIFAILYKTFYIVHGLGLFRKPARWILYKQD